MYRHCKNIVLCIFYKYIHTNGVPFICASIESSNLDKRQLLNAYDISTRTILSPLHIIGVN